MELKFLGCGSAFNYKLDNTSAYFIDNDELFLIDCGATVFKNLMSNDLLKNIKEINVLITHLHSDHIGSLGILLDYAEHILNKKVKIIIAKDIKYLDSLKRFIACIGCPNGSEFILEEEYDDKYSCFSKIRYFETRHTSKLYCYGILFYTSNGVVYYSGDTSELTKLEELLEQKVLIDKIYLDVTNDLITSRVHLYLEDVAKKIPSSIKDKVYCMHFNDESCIVDAKRLGFNVVTKKDEE